MTGKKRRGAILITDIIMSLGLLSVFFFTVYSVYATSPSHESRHAFCQSIARAFSASDYSQALSQVPSQNANDSLQQFVDLLPPENAYHLNASVFNSGLEFVGAASAGSGKPASSISWRASRRLALENGTRGLLFAKLDLDCFEIK